MNPIATILFKLLNLFSKNNRIHAKNSKCFFCLKTTSGPIPLDSMIIRYERLIRSVIFHDKSPCNSLQHLQVQLSINNSNTIIEVKPITPIILPTLKPNQTDSLPQAIEQVPEIPPIIRLPNTLHPNQYLSIPSIDLEIPDNEFVQLSYEYRHGETERLIQKSYFGTKILTETNKAMRDLIMDFIRPNCDYVAIINNSIIIEREELRHFDTEFTQEALLKLDIDENGDEWIALNTNIEHINAFLDYQLSPAIKYRWLKRYLDNVEEHWDHNDSILTDYFIELVKIPTYSERSSGQTHTSNIQSLI